MCTAGYFCHVMQHSCSSEMLLELVLPLSILSCLDSVEHMECGSKKHPGKHSDIHPLGLGVQDVLPNDAILESTGGSVWGGDLQLGRDMILVASSSKKAMLIGGKKEPNILLVVFWCVDAHTQESLLGSLGRDSPMDHETNSTSSLPRMILELQKLMPDLLQQYGYVSRNWRLIVNQGSFDPQPDQLSCDLNLFFPRFSVPVEDGVRKGRSGSGLQLDLQKDYQLGMDPFTSDNHIFWGWTSNFTSYFWSLDESTFPGAGLSIQTAISPIHYIGSLSSHHQGQGWASVEAGRSQCEVCVDILCFLCHVYVQAYVPIVKNWIEKILCTYYKCNRGQKLVTSHLLSPMIIFGEVDIRRQDTHNFSDLSQPHQRQRTGNTGRGHSHFCWQRHALCPRPKSGTLMGTGWAGPENFDHFSTIFWQEKAVETRWKEVTQLKFSSVESVEVEPQHPQSGKETAPKPWADDIPCCYKVVAVRWGWGYGAQ